MKIDWLVVGGVVLCAVILVIFLVRRNLSDKKKLEVFLDKTVNSLTTDETEVNDEESNH